MRNVYIVDGSRTPFLKARGQRGPFAASDLAVKAGQPLLARQTFNPTDLDEVIVGCVGPSENEANIARIIALRLQCGDAMPAFTVQRNCASGMQAIDSAYKDIASGRHDLVLAGGTEAMSHSPLLLSPPMVNWFARMNMSKSILDKVKTLFELRPAYFKPIIGLLCGLTDPVLGLSMGQTAENLAYDFNISRDEMDEFAFDSHQKTFKAQDDGRLSEIETLYGNDGKVYAFDDGVRRDSSIQKLAKLKPFFDKKYGKVTAGNSSQVTDGASLVILASEEAVKKHKLKPLAKIVDVEWAALDPAVMGLGPVHASTPLLQRNEMSLNDVDFWEINEAFATQIIACQRAWEDETYCKEKLNLDNAFGALDLSKVNVDGGAVAIGHPVGASGARIVFHLVKVLQRENAKRGVATICIGGGQGGAMLIERV